MKNEEIIKINEPYYDQAVKEYIKMVKAKSSSARAWKQQLQDLDQWFAQHGEW